MARIVHAPPGQPLGGHANGSLSCDVCDFSGPRLPQGILLKPVTFTPSRLQDVMGCTGYRGSALSHADINAALDADVGVSPKLPA